jgi:hypothetical protein
VVEERLREQRAEGVEMPAGVALDDLALRVLVAATLAQARGAGRRRCAGPEEGRTLPSEHPAPWYICFRSGNMLHGSNLSSSNGCPVPRKCRALLVWIPFDDSITSIG